MAGKGRCAIRDARTLALLSSVESARSTQNPVELVIASSDYGRDFPAVVGRDNVLGVQFHPEKSQAVGLRMVANFVRSLAERRRRSA